MDKVKLILLYKILKHKHLKTTNYAWLNSPLNKRGAVMEIHFHYSRFSNFVSLLLFPGFHFYFILQLIVMNVLK